MFPRTRPALSLAEYAVRLANRSAGENLLVFQQRLHDEREQKRAGFDERHRYLFDLLATRLAFERSDVEDQILESSHVSRLRTSSSDILLVLDVLVEFDQ